MPSRGARLCLALPVRSLLGCTVLLFLLAPAPALAVPPAPTSLTATAGIGKVTLSWTRVTSATGYNIYTSAGAFVAQNQPNTLTTYTKTGLTAGTQYCYFVKAFDSSGQSAATATKCATPTAASLIPERWQTMVGGWGSASPATIAAHSDGVINHSPWTYHAQVDQAKAAKPALKVFAYLSWGYSAASTACCAVAITDAEADAAGFTAKFNGIPAHQSEYEYLRALDQGKAGFGAFWATEVMKDLNANGGTTRWTGVFGDDTNVADSRLPRSGLPDGYSSPAAYATAVKNQLAIARGRLAASGYQITSNVGYAVSLMQQVVGVSDYTFLEFCGAWRGPTPQANQGAPYADLEAYNAARTVASLGRKLVCNTAGDTCGTTTNMRNYHDYFTRIIGEAGRIAGSCMSSYAGGEVWSTTFRLDRGYPVTAPQRSGTHYWRKFSSGITLHVDTYTLQAWTS